MGALLFVTGKMENDRMFIFTTNNSMHTHNTQLYEIRGVKFAHKPSLK